MEKIYCTFIFWITLVASSYSQSLNNIEGMNECQLMGVIDTLNTKNDIHNYYKLLKTDLKIRSAFLKRLEEYIIVFGNFNIAPIYLEKSQNNIFSCSKYVEEYDIFLKSINDINTVKTRKQFQDKKIIDIKNIVFDLCGLLLDDNMEVNKNISEFKKALTLQYIHKYIIENYNDEKDSKFVSQYVKESNLQSLEDRMNHLDSENFVFYETYNSKPDFMKGFMLSHVNDVFQFWWNQDRELTGGFNFILITDYFKWRWLKLFNNEKGALSYQTISLVGNGYTPYIRYRNNFELADSLHLSDRPFSSYFLLGRSKNRVQRNGLIRLENTFQIGSLGISQGRKIQAKIHSDVTQKSQFVHGWDNQIGNGGRLVVQTSLKGDFLLYSNTNRYMTVFRPKNIFVEDKEKYRGINISMETEANLGTILTAFGGGIRYSTLDFLNQSGHYMVKSNVRKKDEFGLNLDVGVGYRYVWHNSLLEGLGLFRTFPKDSYDNDPIDNNTFRKSEIERNLFSLDGGISLRWRKTTFFFRQKIHNLEYKPRLSNIDFNNEKFKDKIRYNKDLSSDQVKEDLMYYQDSIIDEQNSFIKSKFLGKSIYGYGTLGFTWLIE